MTTEKTAEAKKTKTPNKATAEKVAEAKVTKMVEKAEKTEKAEREATRKKDLNAKEVRTVLHGKEADNSRGRGRSAAEKRAAYSKYRETKRQVIELEGRNKKHLVLYPASDASINKKTRFYNMGGNSAVIYVHELAPRIGRKAALRRDMDSCNDNEKFRSGICSIADLAALEERLKRIGIKRVPFKGDLVFFELQREYDRKEIREMLKLEQQRLDNLNKILYSKVLFPDIHRQIIDLKKMIPSKVKNMNKTYREVIGMEMIKSLMTLVRAYTQMTHGDLDEGAAAREMLLECDMILAEISLFNENKVWDIEGCARMGSVVVGLKQLLKGRILNKKVDADDTAK